MNETHIQQELMMLRKRVRELEQMPTLLVGGSDAGGAGDRVFWRPRWANRFDSANPDKVYLSDFQNRWGVHDTSAQRYTLGDAALMQYAETSGVEPVHETWRRNTLLKFDPPIHIDKNGLYWFVGIGEFVTGNFYCTGSSFIITLYATPIWSDWDETTATYDNWSGLFDLVPERTMTGRGFENYVTWSDWFPPRPYTVLWGGSSWFGYHTWNSFPHLNVDGNTLKGVSLPLSGHGPYPTEAWNFGYDMHGIFIGIHTLFAGPAEIRYTCYSGGDGKYGIKFLHHVGVVKFTDAQFTGVGARTTLTYPL